MAIPLFVPLLFTATAVPPAVTESPDPPVQVWFDRDGNYDQGDRVRVFARADRDGYMVILHADLEGRVRILFPLDPVQDDFVRGGQTLEILGRDDEGAFSIVQPEGYGTVLAAWSPDPFYREGLVRGDHWDYRMIAPNGVGDDPEAGLLDIVHMMAGNNRFEYHTAQYLVGYPVYESRQPTYSISLRSNVHYASSSWGGSHFGFGFSIGTPHWSLWYHDDPWYYPSYRRVRYYDPWRYSYWVPVWRPAYWYDPWYDPWWSWRSVRYYDGPRWGVGIRYAGCWDCGPRWNRPYRPGRATGVSFGEAYWARGDRGAATGIAWASGDGYRGPSGQGIARGSGPTRWAEPKGGGTGRGTGTAQPSRIGETRPVITSTPPSRTRSISDNPVRGTSRDDQRVRQQVQPTRAPTVSSIPQRNEEARRPDRNAVVRPGTQATPPSQRTSTIRSQVVPRTSTSEPPSSSSRSNTATRSSAVSRSGIATRSSNTRAVPSTRSTPDTRVVPPSRSSGTSRVVPRSSTPTRTSPPTRSSSGVGSTSRSSGVSRAVPSRSSGSSSRATPPTRSSGASSRAAPTRSSGASSRGTATRSSGSSRSGGGVASRASSSRSSSGSASRSSGSSRRSGGGG